MAGKRPGKSKRCDCHTKQQQVCDRCQGVASSSKRERSAVGAVANAPAAEPLSAANPGWERFAREYLLDHNATQAAIRAGYSPRSAGQYGHELLKDPRVRAIVGRIESQHWQELDIDHKRVLQELAAVAFADIAQVVETDNGRVVFAQPIQDLPLSVRAAIESVESTSERLGEDGLVIRVKSKVKLYSKLTALQKLGEYLKLFEPESGVGKELVIRVVRE